MGNIISHKGHKGTKGRGDEPFQKPLWLRVRKTEDLFL